MNTRALKIIIAGSESSAMTQMATLLDRLGYDVFSAESGTQAIETMQETAVDLVILDGHLSAHDGVATQTLIKRQQQWAHIPVIMMAAKHSKTARDEYIRFGYEGLLTRPFDLQQMHILIQEFLASGGAKKRTNLRIPVDFPITIVHEGNAQQYHSRNLSEGGIFLQTRLPLPVGSIVEIILPIPGMQPLQLTGMVIYQKGSSAEVIKSAAGMAIKFQQPEQLTGIALSHYISGVVLQDMPTGQDSIIDSNYQNQK